MLMRILIGEFMPGVLLVMALIIPLMTPVWAADPPPSWSDAS